MFSELKKSYNRLQKLGNFCSFAPHCDFMIHYVLAFTLCTTMKTMYVGYVPHHSELYCTSMYYKYATCIRESI